jgi:hypothetical protein
MFVGCVIVLLTVLFLGGLEGLGETRLAWIFPVISVVALAVFLARCMFAAPAH